MKKHLLLLAGALAISHAVLAESPLDGTALTGEDLSVPVRPVGVDGQAAWNARATSFLYPPTFGFKAIAGSAKYRFSVNGLTFEDAKPTASLAPVWREIPVGWVSVEARGVAADGRDLGVAGSRRFWKKAAYRPGAYPPAARSYGKAAELAFLNVLNSKSIGVLEKTGDLDRAYPHNCYPAKMLSQIVTGMLELAKMRPDLKVRAVAVAEKAADWMIAHSVAEPSPLAGFPFTYDHHPEAANVEPTACARISKERAGISMNIYPAGMGRAYVALYETDGKPKYLAAAEAIAVRYLALQGEDGTWPLNQRIADGSVIGASRVMPIQGVIPLFEALARVTGKAAYREGADRAFAFVEKGPLATWNWEGQFEDTPQAPKYQNLTKHDACATAIYLLKRFPGDKGRLAQARELLRFSEDQFVFWEKPYTPADEPQEFVEWNRPWAGKWMCPGVTEQYSCYRPIDASASKLIQTYLALYEAEGDPLDLAKAKTLGDMATRMQRADGFIPTFWSDHPHVVHDNWVNCMLYTAETLARLGRCASAVGLGACAHVTRDEFAERQKAFRLMRKAGIDSVRCDFDWRWYQRTKDGPFDWRKCDAVVDDAAKEGLTTLPILCNPPDWAKPVQNHLDDWRSFVRETARHFKGRIPVYEIWNEENHSGFWPNPKAADYVPVLKAAYEEIKAVDPNARVAIGGTAGCDLGYLEGVYKAGGNPFFDIMNVHPYCWPNPPTDGTEAILGQLKALMARHGDTDKPVWVTEMGWPTHKANIPTPGIFQSGLKLARPDRKDWRVGCVGTTDDLGALESVVAGVRQLLTPGSTVRAYTADGLNAALASDALDAVVYPFDESYPLKTIDAVIAFVKKGGVLVDFGGCPMYYARVDGRHVEKAADGSFNRQKAFEAFRLSVYGPNAGNGLVYNQRCYATDLAQRAGCKYDPEGVRVFRFFSAANLREGDELLPLLTAKGKGGKEAIGGCVVRFGFDMKGALVLTGSADGRAGSSESQQADNCLKMISVAEKCGIEKLYFYEFRANERDPFYSEDHFGLTHRDLSPKLAYERLAERRCRMKVRSLFNGRDLTGWYTYLKGRGKNVDPKGVFSVRDGVIHVTGEEFGALVTEEEFADYRLSLEYRFTGGPQFGSKVGMSPDSGLLFHSTGPDGGFYGIWMESIEVNLIKGATGDFWGVGKKDSDRIALSAKVGREKLGGQYAIHEENGKDVYTIKGNTRVCRFDIARDWQDTNTVAVAVNERPIGEWNRVDLRCVGGEVTVAFNGKVVNRGFDAKPRKGRIQLQSEGCPIEFRNIVIEPVRRFTP